MEFLDENGKTARFSHSLWISTTNHWESTANKVLENYEKHFMRLNLTDLREANVDWNALDKGIFGSLAKEKISREPRPHQKDAIKSAHEYFKNNERGKLIMACGTGKTYKHCYV